MKEWVRILALLFLSCRMSIAATELRYYQLRISFVTTSDWAVLQWQDVNAILTCRLVSTVGVPSSTRLYPDQLSVGQTLAKAMDNQSVGLTADYAFDAQTIDRPIGLQLTKGDIGSCQLDVYLVYGSELRTIARYKHSGTVPGSNGRNPMVYQIDLGKLKDVVPLAGQVPDRCRKMVWAFYYPWYYKRDWSSQLLKDRPLEPYSSDDPCAIWQHIEQAKASGIDGFVSSWWGPNSYTDKNLDLLLQIAAQKDFHICVYFETLRDDGPRDQGQISQWLTYLISTYRARPGYFCLDGRPLIMLWASGSLPLDTWRQVISELRAKGLDATYLGMGYDISNLELFEGIHEYAIFNIPNLARVYQNTSRLVRNYGLLIDRPVAKIWAATVQPGYDDRLIPGRAGGFKDRMDGEFYASTFDAAITSEPDWILITTWNEWWEHTYIEPSQLYRDLYLQITADYTKAWKADGRKITERTRR